MCTDIYIYICIHMYIYIGHRSTYPRTTYSSISVFLHFYYFISLFVHIPVFESIPVSISIPTFASISIFHVGSTYLSICTSIHIFSYLLRHTPSGCSNRLPTRSAPFVLSCPSQSAACTCSAVDDTNPESPNQYDATIVPGVLVSKVMQGLYHQQYLWGRFGDYTT